MNSVFRRVLSTCKLLFFFNKDLFFLKRHPSLRVKSMFGIQVACVIIIVQIYTACQLDLICLRKECYHEGKTQGVNLNAVT